MAGETPGGRAVQTGGGEGVEAQLTGTGVNVISNGLQGVEVGDLIQRVAGLLQQRLVDDDAVGLQAVGNGDDLAVGVLQSVVFGSQLIVHSAVAQVIAEIAPSGDAALVALEQGGSAVLVHLGNEHGLILAGSGSNDLDRHAGLISVGLGQSLPGLLGLGLEVQVIDTAGGSVTVTFALCAAVSAASDQRQSHHKSKDQCKKLFHVD